MSENENTPPVPADTPEARAEANAQVAMTNPAMVPDKFKNEDGSVNGDALLQSYLHMEQRMSNAPVSEDPPANEQPQAVTDPGQALDTGAAPSEAGSIAEAFDGPAPVEGSTLWSQVETELSTNGAITEGTLKALRDQGVPETLIASAAYGRQAKLKSDMDAAYDITGGQENFDATMAWAKTNLSEADKATVSEGLKGPNSLVILQGLHARYAAEQATSGQVNTGASGQPSLGPAAERVAPFTSAREQHAAISDPRYISDPEYRAKVDMRMQLAAGINPQYLGEI